MARARLNKGFTLIELLVSIVIITISIIGLMNLSIVITRNNLKNEIRNKAIEIVTNYVDNMTSQSFDDIATGNSTDNASAEIRNFTLTYTITDNVTNPTTNEKDISATIDWQYRSKNYSYNVQTVVTK